MAAVAPLETEPLQDEQRMLLTSITWKDYVLLRDVLDGPGVRMTYKRGVLELMSPSLQHELWKKTIARLVELYAHVKRIDLRGYGQTTFKAEAKECGAEPDECYLVGKKISDYPEIVLEVIWKSPLVSKLDVYAAMGIPEVWVFRDGRFTLYGFDRATGGYVTRVRSELLPELDFERVARFALREDTGQALREFEAEIGR